MKSWVLTKVSLVTQRQKLVALGTRSLLEHSSALAGVIVSVCDFTLTVPLATQVYKWVLVNLKLRGSPVMD